MTLQGPVYTERSPLKILCPPTFTLGLFHGILYYYLIAPFYQLGNGDPRVVAVFLSLLSNLYAVYKFNPQGQIVLVIPNDMNLKNELKLIGETYKIASGKQFSINSLTLPLWTNTTWAYLYSWYGKNKYGYVPRFYNEDLDTENSKTKLTDEIKYGFIRLQIRVPKNNEQTN